MTASLCTLKREKRRIPMKRSLVPAVSPAAMKRVTFAIFCVTLLTLLAAPARADVCSDAFPVDHCGVTITITGSSGQLVATIAAPGPPYDGIEDQLVGITNNSSVEVGAIVLSAPLAGVPLFGFDGDGPCVHFETGNCPGPTGYEGPNNTFVGISTDLTTGKVLFTTPLAANGGTTWFALENKPVSTVAIGETQILVAGQTSIFPFGTGGVDDFQITPLNSAPGDTLTVTPVPVRFADFSAINFPNLRCVPYKDFSGPEDTVCVEIERDCTGSDCGTFLYTAQLDFNIDGNSFPNGIGGPTFLGQHGVPCPTSGFDLNIFFSYTGAVVDPVKGSGQGGGSCFVAAFDPTAAAIATGDTFSSFVGFQSPVSDTDLNIIKAGSAVALKWQQFISPGVPLTNLSWCPLGPTPTPGDPSVCLTPGVSKPWVFIGTIATNCVSDPTPNIETENPAGGSGLQNFGDGSYQFNWKTVKGSTGCVDIVLMYDTGLTLYPAQFKYK
jgi:hypothetical protein